MKAECPICKKGFSFDIYSDACLFVDLNNTNNIYEEYPIRDDQWPSRRWNKDHTDYEDLSGAVAICPECYIKRCNAGNIYVDGHVICSKEGCANDANEFYEYCHECFSETHTQNTPPFTA